jgi:hypothetical protein
MKNVIIGSMLLLSCTAGGYDSESIIADTVISADTTIVADTIVPDSAVVDSISVEVK